MIVGHRTLSYVSFLWLFGFAPIRCINTAFFFTMTSELTVGYHPIALLYVSGSLLARYYFGTNEKSSEVYR